MVIPLFFERINNVAKKIFDQNAYFANIFVLTKGMSFVMKILGPDMFVSEATMLADKNLLLIDFTPRYKKMK